MNCAPSSSPRAPWGAAVLAAAVLASCSPSTSQPPASGPDKPAGSAVVAQVHGQDVTAAELDGKAAAELQPLRQKEYEVRREALEELIAERLFEKEAAARGVSVEALLAEEVERKAGKPDPTQVHVLYEQNRAHLGRRTLEDVRGEIEGYLLQQARTARREAFRAELAAKAKVKVTLPAPRFEVNVPATAPVHGPAGAPVTIVAFADYQCPYCQRAQETLDELLRRYPSKLRLVHRDFPLDFHPRARVAARASYCAGEQGRFWEYHRGLLVQPGDYSDADLHARARALGLQEPPFAACLGSNRFDAVIAASIQDGARLGVNSTPTFFINGRMLSGARPIEHFTQVIEEELAAGS